MSVRRLQGNALISTDQPAILLHVDKAFAALPVPEFPIRGDTWVERYLFVDSGRHKTVKRMVVVQFEHAQTGSAFRFVYPPRPPMQWGNAVYRHGAFLADDAAETTEHPDLEVAKTRAYLARNGYKVGNWWRVARLARAADPEGKTEIIIFYQEALSAKDARTGRADEDLPEKEADALFARFKLAVRPD